MSNIPSANQKIQIEATQYRGPVSESLLQTVGGSVNYALDQVASNASSIASVSGSLSTLTTELNSSAQCMKLEATSSSTSISIGTNSAYVDFQLIDTKTFNLVSSATGYILVYFAAQRVDTSRNDSYMVVTLLNDPSYGSQILNPSSSYIGFNDTYFLVPAAATTYHIQVSLYAGGSTSGSPTTRNRWEFKYQAIRFNPQDFIIP